MSERTKDVVVKGPAGTRLRPDGKDGPQIVRTKGCSWSDEAEAIFLDHLAASCNVSWAAEQAGFHRVTIYRHRRRDPGFAQRWQEALEQGFARLEMELVRAATDYLEGTDIDSDRPIKAMSVKDAIAIMSLHRGGKSGEGPRGPRFRARPKTLDEVRDSILIKLERMVVAGVIDAPKGDGLADA